MGGKKKTLANKLAKMSDEERARYLQHKADQEEEAKRRKEQLIATFMKNKVKKEDAFSRLNLAKINQHWHQILRTNKCKEMKEDVEHMKRYIDRVLDYKNRTIGKLMEELELAEEQYCHNFQAHTTHIDKNLATNKEYLQKLEDQYEEDLEDMLGRSEEEMQRILQGALEQQEHLKTIALGQSRKAKQSRKRNYDHLVAAKNELSSQAKIELGAMVRRQEQASGVLWGGIGRILRSYVQRTDARRCHLAELRRLDADSAAEIAANQDRITSQEEEIKTLTHALEKTKERNEAHIAHLNKEIRGLKETFLALKRKLHFDIEGDKKKLLKMTHVSNASIEALEELWIKGRQILGLGATCRKFETPREKLGKWLPCFQQGREEEEVETEVPKKSSWYSQGSSASNEERLSQEGDEEVTQQRIVIKTKTPVKQRDPREVGTSTISCLDHLGDLEEFWKDFGKVEVDCKELRAEKAVILQQNKEFRGMMRAVLEAAVLVQSVPPSRVSTRLPSKRSTASKSAPLRRIIL